MSSQELVIDETNWTNVSADTTETISPKVQPTLSPEELTRIRHMIDAADLTNVLNRLVRVEGWPVKAAKTGIALYRNFLYLVAKYPNMLLPPSQEMDEVWHAHILHTRDYRNFCQNTFGRYIDHDPSDHKLDAPFENMQRLYKAEFGDYIYQVRRIGWNYIRIMLKRLWMTI